MNSSAIPGNVSTTQQKAHKTPAVATARTPESGVEITADTVRGRAVPVTYCDKARLAETAAVVQPQEAGLVAPVSRSWRGADPNRDLQLSAVWH